MGSAKKQTVGYKYYLGVHMPFCHGPIDKVTRIRVDDRVAWEGESTGGSISVNAPSLFGGDDREGGISGTVDFEFGEPTQTVNGYLQSKQQDDIPAYRGVAAAVLRQVYMGTNPYIKPWEFRAQRIHTSTRGATQWYDAKAEIGTVSEVFRAPINDPGTWIPQDAGYFVIGASQEIAGTYNTPSDQGWLNGNIHSVRITDGIARHTSDSYTIPNDAFSSSDPYWNNVVCAVVSTPSGPIDLKGNSVGVFGATLDLSNELFGSPTMSFDGVNDYLTVTVGSSAATLGSRYTVEAWVKLNVYKTTTHGNPVLSYGKINVAGDDVNYSVYNDHITFNQYEAPAVESTSVSVTGDLEVVPLSTFVFLEWVRDGDLSYLYVNGKLATGYVGYSYGDMNPAHIIRECLTDTTWGLGYTSADIDDISFTSAADTLYDEEFGLSFLWSKEVEIEEFIQGVLRHIDAALYVSPSSGKFVLKLIRDDYVLGDLPVFDESNIISIQDYKKPTLDELKNYVSVKYWDKSKSEDATVTVTDPALALQQGSTISETLQFDGITRGALATRVAQRSLAELSNPLITCSVIANRNAHSLNIGNAFKLSWPKYGISEVVMRVTNISFGELSSGQIKIDCAQDVFGLPDAAYSEPADSNFTPIVNDPSPIVDQIVRESDYWSLVQTIGETDINGVGSLDGFLLTAAGQPISDSISYRIWTDETGSYTEKESADFCPVATLSEDMPKASDGAVVETVSITGLSDDDIEDIDAGSMCQIGDELMVVESVSTTSLTVGRAVSDSVIANHVSGDKVYFYGVDFAGSSTTLFQDGESINVKLTPITGQGQLNVGDATAEALTFDQRQYRAWPPGNLQIESTYFPGYLENVNDITATWAHRDRTLQTADLNDFTEGNIGPEVGVTYSTTLTRIDTGATIDSSSGITGTSETLALNGYTGGVVQFSIKSVRDSLDSYFSQTHTLPVTPTEFIFTEQNEFLEPAIGEYIITES